MFANQVPLLRLGETNAIPDEKPDSKGTAVQQFLNIREPERPDGRPAPPFLHIIAVTDPNDLLSYPLQRGDLVFNSTHQIEFGNVLICNAPALLRWVANPIKAHEGYFDNPRLIKLLINGYHGRSKSCIQ